MKKDKTLPKISNDIAEWTFDAKPFEKEYEKILKASAPKEEFLRISWERELYYQFYNFELKTPTQKGYFCIKPPFGDIDLLWHFVEALALGKEFASCLAKYEGTNAILLAKAVDKENIRVTLLGDTWLELQKGYYEEKCWPDREAHASIDVVLNRRHFIYTLYMALFDLWVNADDSVYFRFPHQVNCKELAQVDSLIIQKYLGYVPKTELDNKLWNALMEGTPSEVEKLLKQGANPNAWGNTESNKEPQTTMLEDYWNQSLYENNEEYKQKYTSFVRKNELLCQYGAMPRSFFYLMINGYPVPEEDEQKVFHLFFDKNAFIGWDFWNILIDAHNAPWPSFDVYDDILLNALWKEPRISVWEEYENIRRLPY